MRLSSLALLLPLAPAALVAQSRSPLDPTVHGVVYDVPATRSVELHPGVQVGTSSGRPMFADV